MADPIARRNVLEGMTLAALTGTAAMAGTAASAATSPPASDEARRIIALAEALEKAEEAKDPDAWAAMVAEDYTELNGHFGQILKGRDLAKRMQQFARDIPHLIVGSYMSNPDVQIFGDLAILCYVSMRSIADKEGRSDPACRRVTRIYARRGQDWMLTHTHFSSFDYVSTY